MGVRPWGSRAWRRRDRRARRAQRRGVFQPLARVGAARSHRLAVLSLGGKFGDSLGQLMIDEAAFVFRIAQPDAINPVVWGICGLCPTPFRRASVTARSPVPSRVAVRVVRGKYGRRYRCCRMSGGGVKCEISADPVRLRAQLGSTARSSTTTGQASATTGWVIYGGRAGLSRRRQKKLGYPYLAVVCVCARQ